MALLTNESPYHKQFRALLDQIRGEVASLKDEIEELKKENEQLTSKLEELQDSQADIFSSTTESERIALRHQVLGLISKIDTHLEDQ